MERAGRKAGPSRPEPVGADPDERGRFAEPVGFDYSFPMGLSITFLGHSGFVLDDGTHRLAIDPFLTGNPRAVHAPEELEVTHIALTHGHADHIGDTVAIAKRTGATGDRRV